jgi:hypothetical protein
MSNTRDDLTRGGMTCAGSGLTERAILHDIQRGPVYISTETSPMRSKTVLVGPASSWNPLKQGAG